MREARLCMLRSEPGDTVLCTFGGGRGGSYAFDALGRNPAAVRAAGGKEA